MTDLERAQLQMLLYEQRQLRAKLEELEASIAVWKDRLVAEQTPEERAGLERAGWGSPVPLPPTAQAAKTESAQGKEAIPPPLPAGFGSKGSEPTPRIGPAPGESFRAWAEEQEEQARRAQAGEPQPPPVPPSAMAGSATSPSPNISPIVPGAAVDERGVPIEHGTNPAHTSRPSPEESMPAPEDAANVLVSPPPRGELEMQLGSVWLARIGIVVLLTGFVFLGNYAWHEWVAQMGAGGKLAILYVLGALLMAGGGALSRHRAELKTYGQVLMAGGAAAIYYATYAAHFVEALRVIESPVAAGVVLLIVGGLFLVWAVWRQLQTAAVLAILLSYYTAAINPIGQFTLFSNLVLTAAAAVLLIRERWVTVSWVSLAGTYGSFAYFRLFGSWYSSAPVESWRTHLAFLATYWVLFTAATFWTRETALTPRQRASFLTLNNAAFFLLGAQVVASSRTGSFWLFTLLFGAALLLLAAAAWYWRRDEGELDAAYLVQGVGLVTTGLIARLEDDVLALTLAVQSLTLLTGAGRRHGGIYQGLALLTAGAAFVFAWDALTSMPERMTLVGGGVGALLIADAWWLKVRRGEWRAMRLSIEPSCYVGGGLILFCFVIMQRVYAPWEPAALALVTVLCTASIYVLRLPEVTVLGQLPFAAALWVWFFEYSGPLLNLPWWQPWPLIVAGLALAHWWQRQRVLVLSTTQALVWQAIPAFGLIWTLRLAGLQYLAGDTLLIVLSVGGLALLAYGIATRAWLLALFGQMFAVDALVQIFEAGRGGSGLGLGVLLAAAIFMVTAGALLRLKTERLHPLLQREHLRAVSAVYWCAAWGVVAYWIHLHLPLEWRTLAFSLVASGMLAGGTIRRAQVLTMTGAVYAGFAYCTFAAKYHTPPYLKELLAILLLPMGLRIGAKYAPTEQKPASQGWVELQRWICILTVAAVWWWATDRTRWSGNTRVLTVVWSAVALLTLGAGLALRERVYRVGGFVILAFALGRIFFIDVWQLETIYRILSFLTLGIVLLVLGYFYNRYSEQIRKWL